MRRAKAVPVTLIVYHYSLYLCDLDTHSAAREFTVLV